MKVRRLVRKAIQELITGFKERCFRGVPVNGFERESFNPKVIKLFAGDLGEMGENSSVSVSYKVIEEFGCILGNFKPIEFITVVMPRNPDYMEGCLIFFSVN